MAIIRPPKAIRYSGQAAAQADRVVAPPYDVLSQADAAALKARSPWNITHVDLPVYPPKAAGPKSAYEGAAAELAGWMKAGVLAQDAQAGLYPYIQRFGWGGKQHERFSLFAVVRLSEFGKGEVIPHERTYPGPIEDRLCLMRETQTQLSPILGVFDDPEGVVSGLLRPQMARPVFAAATDSGSDELFRVSDPQVTSKVCDWLSSRPVFIADGHHRYTTALAYRKERIAAGDTSEDHPSNWCMFVLSPIQDPGMLVLPTHRLLGGPGGATVESILAAAKGKYSVVAGAPANPIEAIDQWLPTQPKWTVIVLAGSPARCVALRPSSDQPLSHVEASQAWRDLDVSVLERGLIDPVISPLLAPGGSPTREYTHDSATLIQRVNTGEFPVGIALQTTSVAQMRDVALNGERMPQKSTYFHPKATTGIALYSLAT